MSEYNNRTTCDIQARSLPPPLSLSLSHSVLVSLMEKSHGDQKDIQILASTIDPSSGFCLRTMTFHSLRAKISLPSDQTQRLSVTSYVFSHLPRPLPDKMAFINATTGATLSFAELRSQVHSLAAALRCSAVGLSKGDVAFVLAPTCLEVPVLYFALLSIGAVVCPCSVISTEKDVSRMVGLVNPSVAFTTSATAHLLPHDLPAILLDSPRFRSFLVDDSAVEEDVGVRLSDVAVMLFTSGTTGIAKAAALTHRNYIAMIAGYNISRGARSSPSDVMLLLAPLFHSLGFFFSLKGVALGETTVVMGRAGFSDMLRVADKYHATRITTAPPMVVAMSNLPKKVDYDLSAVKCLVSGGAPLQESTIRRFTSRFPWMVIEQGYGSTEGGCVAKMNTEEECENFKSVGRLNENLQAKIVDPVSGESLPVDRQGELRLKGPSIMKGYVDDEKATVHSFDSDGWLKTGDLCYFDREGYLYIVGRLKEIIKYKAYQVPPVELERVLQPHTEILDAAVVPYPNEEAGEIPMAFVVKKPGSSISESEIMNFVAKQVAPYKKIRKVAFIDSIPKTPSGKILRRELASLAIST